MTNVDFGIFDKLDSYQILLKEEGFQEILNLDFTRTNLDDGTQMNEKFFVYYHFTDGILLTFETHGGSYLNGGYFYYNFLPNKDNRKYERYLSSGRYANGKKGLVWIGCHECREDFPKRLDHLRQYGTFLKEWSDSFYPSLVHSGDRQEAKHFTQFEEVTAQRILLLSLEVQKSITGRDVLN